MTDQPRPERAVVLDTPEQIETYALSVTIKALEMEINHGMRLTSRMPTLRQIKQRWGVEGRTKVAVLNNLKQLKDAQLREMGIDPEEKSK